MFAQRTAETPTRWSADQFWRYAEADIGGVNTGVEAFQQQALGAVHDIAPLRFEPKVAGDKIKLMADEEENGGKRVKPGCCRLRIVSEIGRATCRDRV